MDAAVGIAFTAGLPFAGLRGVEPDPTLLAGFPPGWLAARTLLPLAFADGTLTLACATATPDLSGLDPALRIALVLSPAREIAACLAAAGAGVGPEVEEPREAEPPRAAPPAAAAPPLAAPPPAAAPSRPAAPAPTPAALARVPESLQRRLRCVPITVDGETVHVALAEPLPESALDALRRSVAPSDLRTVLVDPASLDERLVAAHGDAWAAFVHDGLPRSGDATAPARSTPDPPRTTLLLPLAGGVGPAVQAATTLAALDHPPQQLEVVLLVGAHDAQGALAARTTGHRVVRAPATLPTDRLALLDLGLLLARGEHVAVLDPGDIPAARLLAHADAALARAGVAAVLARQPPQPAPAPARRAFRRAAPAPPPPVPTTGVVVRRAVLEAVGGWRDLGARLHEAGLAVVTLDDAVAGAPAERS